MSRAGTAEARAAATARPVETVTAVRARLAVGAPPGRLDRLPAAVARAVRVARAAGAPVLPALDAAARAEQDREARRRALRLATAQARTVAAGLVLLPIVLVPGLGRLLGLDLLAFYTSPAGLLVAMVALALLLAGAGLVWRMVHATGRGRPAGAALGPGLVAASLVAVTVGVAPGILVLAVAWLRVRRRGPAHLAGADEVADLVATAITAGLSVPAALRLVGPHLPTLADHAARLALSLELGRTICLPAPLDRLAMTVATCTSWGADAAPALRDLADELRAADQQMALEAAERLPALLAIPTALCLLPASLLLVGAPLIAGVLAGA